MSAIDDYLLADDAVLMSQCDVDCYRASGPGGQKRNKTSSAVRLRHRPTGLATTAEEDRSQHVNKRRALRRLRAAIALSIREERTSAGYRPSDRLVSCVGASGHRGIHVGLRDPRYYPVVAEVLDLLQVCHNSISDTAELIGVSTANLVKFLRNDSKLWERVNQMRAIAGIRPLR